MDFKGAPAYRRSQLFLLFFFFSKYKLLQWIQWLKYLNHLRNTCNQTLYTWIFHSCEHTVWNHTLNKIVCLQRSRLLTGRRATLPWEAKPATPGAFHYCPPGRWEPATWMEGAVFFFPPLPTTDPEHCLVRFSGSVAWWRGHWNLESCRLEVSLVTVLRTWGKSLTFLES